MNLTELVKQEHATLVDVREPWELSDGQIEGAVNIPLGQVPQRIDEFRSMDKPLILFCRSGNRSGMATAILQAQGVENVHNGGSWNEVATALRQETPTL